MNREIKFRAWLKDAEQFAEVRHISFFKGETVVKIYDQPMREEIWFEIEDLELLQYTGLKDKNGVEIYEGDIIENISDKVNIYGEKTGRKSVKRFRVGWHCEGKWHSFPTMSEEYKGIIGVFRPEIYSEVIGNIYENPELLEATK